MIDDALAALLREPMFAPTDAGPHWAGRFARWLRARGVVVIPPDHLQLEAHMGQDRYFATHRVFTGTPVSRGYVYDRFSGKPVAACPHRHRVGHAIQAQQCAERLLRKFLRDTASPRKPA